MQLRPLYDDDSIVPSYKLWYAWSGWPEKGESLAAVNSSVLDELAEPWESDGLRVLESACCPAQAQVVFSVKPRVSPVWFVGRVKGRLQHLLRKTNRPVGFSRKVAMRSVGENHTADVVAYIHGQVEQEAFADPRFEALLKQFTVVDHAVDLSQPTETLSGRYWYNLHVVLVAHERYRVHQESWLAKIRDQSFRIADKKGHRIASLSAMPDHLHLALRGNLEHSPQEIARAFQNNLAYALGQIRIWQPTYYVATFGEYDMGAVRWHSTPANSSGR